MLGRFMGHPEIEHCNNVVSAYTELVLGNMSVERFQDWCSTNTTGAVEEHCLTLYYKLFSK